MDNEDFLTLRLLSPMRDSNLCFDVALEDLQLRGLGYINHLDITFLFPFYYHRFLAVHSKLLCHAKMHFEILDYLGFLLVNLL